MPTYGECVAVHFPWYKRASRRFGRWSWWYTMPVASFIHARTRQYLEPPLDNRWLAGLAEACWTHVCGHGIGYSLHIGMIYWRPR